MPTTAPTPQGVISWTPTKLKRFKAAVANAQHEGRYDLDFEGYSFVVAYATYLIQHLDNQFSKDKT